MDAAGQHLASKWQQNANLQPFHCRVPDSWANNIKYHRWSLNTRKNPKTSYIIHQIFFCWEFWRYHLPRLLLLFLPTAGGEIVKVDSTRWVCLPVSITIVCLFARDASCLFAPKSLCLRKWEYLYYFWAITSSQWTGVTLTRFLEVFN